MEDALSKIRDVLVQRLVDSYRAYFDIETVEENGSGLCAVCAYHSRDSRYVLVKKAELWAAESHEYLYLYSLPRLSAEEDIPRIVQAVLEDGMPRIRPHREHMYTYLTAVIVCDQADPEAAVALKRVKKRREFKLSLHGWMELHIAAVDLSTGAIFTNRSGKDLRKALRPFVDTVLKSI